MPRIVYLNGDYLPADEAKISIFDRAVNFGDAVYEVAGVLEAGGGFTNLLRRFACSTAASSISRTTCNVSPIR